MHAKDLSEPKYEFLIKKGQDAGIKHLNDLNAFIESSNTMDNVYENIDDYNTNKERKVLIVFDDMIADIMSSKKFQAVVKELFIRCRELNIWLVFVNQSYFFVPNMPDWFNSLPNNQDSQQKRISKYCNESFCRYWL